MLGQGGKMREEVYIGGKSGKVELRGEIPENMREPLEKLGEFIGVDSIEYEDLGIGENYILRKDGKVITLYVRGNKFDGGFMTVDFGQPPKKFVRKA